MKPIATGTLDPTSAGARDLSDSQADISTARNIVGCESILSFEDGLKQTVER